MTPARFATLSFERSVAAPCETLWKVWTVPAARALWAAPSPEVTVEFLESTLAVGGREVSLCKVAGQPDIRVEGGWLELEAPARSVSYEMLSCEVTALSAALMTAEFTTVAEESRLRVTVQLASLAEDMEEGYVQGFGAGLDNLSDVAARSMVLSRVIKAPVAVVWGAWINPATLPQWWGPDGFSCRTARIDLRTGGHWVFDMIAPDGTVFPNHHVYTLVQPESRIDYTLLWGENGPKHADAWVTFEEIDGATRVTLGMALASAAEHAEAKAFGAEALGMQTLGKLARFVGTV